MNELDPGLAAAVVRLVDAAIIREDPEARRILLALWEPHTIEEAVERHGIIVDGLLAAERGAAPDGVVALRGLAALLESRCPEAGGGHDWRERRCLRSVARTCGIQLRHGGPQWAEVGAYLLGELSK